MAWSVSDLRSCFRGVLRVTCHRMAAAQSSSLAASLLRCATPPRVIVLVDANNVRGKSQVRALDQFCTVVWRWWKHRHANQQVAVLLCIDHGSREASVSLSDGFAVVFSGRRNDADTDIVVAVEEFLELHPTAQLRIVTNDRQLKVRCKRHLPEIEPDVDDAWYEAHDLEKPGARYEREFTKGTPRTQAQLDRMSFVPSEAFAAEMHATGATRGLSAPSSSAANASAAAQHLWWYAWIATSLWHLWRLAAWCLGMAVREHPRPARPSATFLDGPFAMGEEASARRAAFEKRNKKRRKHSPWPNGRGTEWRTQEADELIITVPDGERAGPHVRTGHTVPSA